MDFVRLLNLPKRTAPRGSNCTSRGSVVHEREVLIMLNCTRLSRRVSGFLAVALLGTAAAGLTGCNSDQAAGQMSDLVSENEELRAQLNDRNADLASNTPVAVDPPSGATEFDNIPGVNASQSAGEITATVESDVLFQSGKAELKAAAKRSLDAVASVLNSSYAGNSVRISGHTDSDPIRKSGFKSNYHLGFERAYAVRAYLASRGVESRRMYIASHGPDRPAGSKAESRRVDITVVLN